MTAKDIIKKTIDIYNKYAKRYHFYNQHKLLQFELNEFISMLPKNANVLDAGCGTGRDAKYLSDEGCNVTGIDISEGMLKVARANTKEVTFKKMDILDLKFPEEEFDGIISIVTLLDIPKKNLNKVLENFHKVLKKKGVIFMTLREGDGEEIIKDKKYDNKQRFFSFYQKEEIENALKKHKFKIIKSDFDVGSRKKYIQIFCQKI